MPAPWISNSATTTWLAWRPHYALKPCPDRATTKRSWRGLIADLNEPNISSQSRPSSVSLCRTRSRDRQRITPFVIRLPGVRSDVYPGDLVVAGQLLEFLPQIPVHHWLSIGDSPAVGLPPRKELGDSTAYILRIGHQGDLAGTIQSPQSFNGRDQFHPIVGRVRHTTLQDPLMLTAPEDARPASGTGVPEARTVSCDLNFAHIRPPFRRISVATRADPSGSHLAMNSKSCSPAQARTAPNELNRAPSFARANAPSSR